MNLTALSVKRPAAVFMFVLLVVGLGVLGYMNLGADLLPAINSPVITVVTNYRGAGVEEIEKDIVKPVEDAVAGIKGIDTIRSGAAVGYGYTLIMFKMEANMDSAFMDVQQALGDIGGKLPKDASTPLVKKYDKNADPIMMLSLSGDLPMEQLRNRADKIRQAVEKIDGVGGVNLQGINDKELGVEVDKAAIEHYGIPLNLVVNRLLSENVDIPAGEIKQGARSHTIKVAGQFEDINEIKNLRIPIAGGGNVRLSDIAEVKLIFPEPDNIARSNNISSIGIIIQKQSDANIVKTTDNIKKELLQISKVLPEGMKLTLAKDESKFINITLNEVKKNLIEGIFTTSLVMFLFLRKWRSSLIVLVSIPTSLIATCFMMYEMKFTLNLMSLLGLSLCIGILVDDSIVVLENIQRHLKMGKEPWTAAIEGRKEIGMAAIAITLCDVVVFTPMAFMTGLVGQVFKEFGLTVVFATLFSLLVSFTLTPMLASKLLKKEKKTVQEGKKEVPEKEAAGGFGKIMEIYRRFLLWALNNRWKVIAMVLVGVIASAALIPLGFIQGEFLPKMDQSMFSINLRLTPGSTLEQTDRKVKQVEEYLKTRPEVKDFFATIGSKDDKASAKVIVNLVGKKERTKSQNQIATEVRTWGKKLDGIDFTVEETTIAGMSSVDGSKPVVMNITGPDPVVLNQLARQVENIAATVNGIVDIDNTSKARQSEYNIRVDSLAAAELGFSTSEIAGTIRTALNGTNAGVYRKDGEEYDILVKLGDGQIKTREDIGTLKLLGSAGQQAYVNQVATVKEMDSPQEILRQDRQNKVTVSANIEGRVLGAINTELKEKLKGLSVPGDYKIQFGGDQENMTSTFDSLLKVLAASIILVYMVLVVLYESYLTPVIRMLSLPCGVIGAFVALAVTGNSLNMITMIGFIMLDGLASKNGTLLIDYTNTLMKKGMSMREALVEAGTTRLKPIIMTSVTMIVGMIPSALALGEGSEIKSGMAIVLIGGMITSTLLTPVLLPVVYTLFDDVKKTSGHAKKQAITNFGGAGE